VPQSSIYEIIMTTLSEITRLLVADNIRHRLFINGFSNENDFTRYGFDTITDKVRRSIRFLCNEVYQKHDKEFEVMIQNMHIVPNNIYNKLQTVMVGVFLRQD